MKIKVSASNINTPNIGLTVPGLQNIGIGIASGAAGASFLLQKGSIAEFPSVGKPQFLYIALDTGKSYVWDDTNFGYLIVGTNYEDIKVIDGGKANG